MTQLDLDNIKTKYHQAGRTITLGEQGIPYVRGTPYSESLHKELLERVRKGQKKDDRIDLFIEYNEHLHSDSRKLAEQIGAGLLGKFYSGRKLPENLEGLNELGYGTEDCVIVADDLRGNFIGSFSKNIKINARKISGNYLCMDADGSTVVTEKLEGLEPLESAKNSKLITRKLRVEAGHNAENSIIVVTDELTRGNTFEESSNSVLVARKIEEPLQGTQSNNLTIFAADFPKEMLDLNTYQGPFGNFFYAPNNLRVAKIEEKEFDSEWTPSNIEERIKELQEKHSKELQKALFSS